MDEATDISDDKETAISKPVTETKNVLVQLNKLSGDYAVSIKGAPGQMYFVKGKKSALKFASKIQKGFDSGDWYLNGQKLELRK